MGVGLTKKPLQTESERGLRIQYMGKVISRAQYINITCWFVLFCFQTVADIRISTYKRLRMLALFQNLPS